MRRLLDTLRALAIATVAIVLILPSQDSPGENLHEYVHIHHGTTSARQGHAHLDLLTIACHGALSCHAAIAAVPGDLSGPASVWRISHRKQSNLQRHLVHPVFDPPPPRIAV